jgi:hypothetical protein
LCYAEYENGEANAAYVPVLTGECQVIAGFRFNSDLELELYEPVAKNLASTLLSFRPAGEIFGVPEISAPAKISRFARNDRAGFPQS